MSEHCLMAGCKLINFPTHVDCCFLTVIEGDTIPFKIKRVFYMEAIDPFTKRGEHALKTCHQVIVPIIGFVRITIESDQQIREMPLRPCAQGVYIPPSVWRTLDRFSHDAVILVLASEEYDPGDYYRDKDEWRKALADQSG